jgi:hypothetical protein
MSSTFDNESPLQKIQPKTRESSLVVVTHNLLTLQANKEAAGHHKTAT